MLMGCVSGYLRSCLAHISYKVSGWIVLICNLFVLKLVLPNYFSFVGPAQQFFESGGNENVSA